MHHSPSTATSVPFSTGNLTYIQKNFFYLFPNIRSVRIRNSAFLADHEYGPILTTHGPLDSVEIIQNNMKSVSYECKYFPEVVESWRIFWKIKKMKSGRFHMAAKFLVLCASSVRRRIMEKTFGSIQMAQGGRLDFSDNDLPITGQSLLKIEAFFGPNHTVSVDFLPQKELAAHRIRSLTNISFFSIRNNPFEASTLQHRMFLLVETQRVWSGNDKFFLKFSNWIGRLFLLFLLFFLWISFPASFCYSKSNLKSFCCQDYITLTHAFVGLDFLEFLDMSGTNMMK